MPSKGQGSAKKDDVRRGLKAKLLPYTPRSDLSPDEKRIEQEVGLYFSTKTSFLIRKYHRRFKNVIDRNNAQELFALYSRNRESRQRLSLATHEPAGALADEVYFAMVRKPAPDSSNVVLFNAGGQGSGKTTSLRYSPLAQPPCIIMDGTMQDFHKGCRNIELALKNGKPVHVNYVYCPFPKAVEHIIRRASSLDGGRVVNIKRAAKGHYNALRNIFRFEEKYKDNQQVSFLAVDNTGDEPKLITMDELRAKPQPSVDALEAEGYGVVDDYFSAKQESDPSLTDELYQFLKGEPR